MIPYLNAQDFAALSPLLILLTGLFAVLLVESFYGTTAKKSTFYLTLITFAATFFATLYAPASNNALLTLWLKYDQTATFFTLFFSFIGFGATLLASPFFQTFNPPKGEYFFLLIAAIFGLVLIGASADFLTLFIGIETLSLSLYILCGYMKKWHLSQESAIKYFLMGALAAGFLLYGIALIYGATGTTNLDALYDGYLNLRNMQEAVLFFSGIGLITIGLAFEAALVPFHVWAPDVYDGAPTPVTALMAIGTKVGAFAAFARVFLIALPNFNLLWNEVVSILAYITLIYANIVAVRQIQLRRFFAYSGISHAGFLLIPIIATTQDSLQALNYYLVVYALATFGCFAVLAFLDKRSEGVTLSDLHGLFQRSPFLAVVLSLCLLTLAGFPPTAGFFAKLYIFKVAFQAGFIELVIIGLLTTILSAFYYLRIVAVLFAKAPEEISIFDRHWSAAFVGAFSAAAILLLSIIPTPLLEWLK